MIPEGGISFLTCVRAMAALLTLFCLAYSTAGSASLLDNAADIPVNEDQRLTTNYLLYDGSNSCASKIAALDIDYREKIPMTKNLARQFFGASPGNCATVCLEKGTHVDFLMNPLPIHVDNKGDDFQAHIRDNCQKVEAGILNYNKSPVDVLWIDFDGNRQKLQTVKYGEKNTAWQTTFLGHQFEIADSVTGETLLAFTVTENAFYHIGELPSAIQERGRGGAGEEHLQHGVATCARGHPHFTELGFDKGRLPDDLWASISALLLQQPRQ